MIVSIFHKSARSQGRFSSLTLSSVMAYGLMAMSILACLNEDPIKSSRKQAIQSCKDQLEAIGFNLDETDIELYPHPLTVDSVFRGIWRPDRSTESFWYERTKKYLSGRRFWAFYCGPRAPALDGDCEIYVDADSGKPLYVYPWGTPEELATRRYGRWAR